MIAVKAGFVVPVVAALALTTSAGADAGVGTEAISSTPASYTPWLLKTVANQYVRQITQCGDTMYAVGTISAVGQGSNTYSRGNAFSFSASSGAVTDWNPQADGPVYSVALSPDCATAYLGGAFHMVHGTPANNIVAVDTASGAVKAEFAHDA